MSGNNERLQIKQETFSQTCVFHPTFLDNGAMIFSIEVGSFLDQLPDTIVLLNETWKRKHEFHATMVSHLHHYVRDIEALSGEEKSLELIRLRSAIEESMSGLRFTLTPIPDWYMVEDLSNGAATIMIRCTIEGAAEFYSRLHQIFGGPVIEFPPHHITIYVRDNEASYNGIGIVNQQQINEMTHAINRADIPFDLQKIMP